MSTVTLAKMVLYMESIKKESKKNVTHVYAAELRERVLLLLILRKKQLINSNWLKVFIKTSLLPLVSICSQTLLFHGYRIHIIWFLGPIY